MEVLRIVLLVFFVTHIPATLLVDAQAGMLRGMCCPVPRLLTRRLRQWSRRALCPSLRRASWPGTWPPRATR